MALFQDTPDETETAAPVAQPQSAPPAASGSFASRVAGAFVPSAPDATPPTDSASRSYQAMGAAQPAPAAVPIRPVPPKKEPVVEPADLDAFTDYMYKVSQEGGLPPGAAPVKYTSATAPADYKAKLIKGNPNTYLAWKASAPAVGQVYKEADAAAKAPSITDPGTPATGGEDERTLPSYMSATRETAMSAPGTADWEADEPVDAADVTLNKAGTAPAGQTKASFKEWMTDKFGKKADKLDFWDAIEIWGAALAGQEPRIYQAKMDRLKEGRDKEQRQKELTEERSFQEKLQTMLSDRETAKLLAMQNFDATQGALDRTYRAGESGLERTWKSSEATLDREARLAELEREYKTLLASLEGKKYDSGTSGYKPPSDRSGYKLD